MADTPTRAQAPSAQRSRDHFNDFDLDSAEFTAEYEEVLGDLVTECPVARSKVAGGYWVISRYDDVRSCAQDWETFSSEAGFEPGREDAEARLYPVELDPPYQTRWRNVLGPHFAPRTVREREPSIRAQADVLIDGVIENGECDFVADFAAHLPGRVFFGTFLGVESEDELRRIQAATDLAMRGPMAERPAGWDEVGAFLVNYLQMRQNEPPRGDFVDVVLAGVDDHDGQPASFTHKMFIMIDLLAGGIGTTTFLLSGLAYHLATHPEDKERLAADPSLHANAIEELIRYYSSIVALGRKATRDTEVAGQKIAEGEFLMLSFAAACRDPAVFPDPNRIDLGRKIAVNPAFSFGPHRCIGSHVARLEGVVTLNRILERMPDLRLKPGSEPTYSNSTITRNMDTLPLVFTPGPKVGS